MGPETCPEWCAASARWVPARSMRDRWAVARVFFLARRGRFTAKGLAERLGMPLSDTYPGKRKPGNWLDATLWRVRVDEWSDEYDEVAVTLREGDEIGRLRGVFIEALEDLREVG